MEMPMCAKSLTCLAVSILVLGRIEAVGQSRAADVTPAAETREKHDPLNRQSPQSSVASFLQACRAHDYARACSYLDLRKFPQAARLNEGGTLSQQLEQIFDRDAHFDVADLSDDPGGSKVNGVPEYHERVDSFQVNGQKVDLDLERIRLRSGLWIWVFSADTLANVPRLVRVTSESVVERHLPDPLVNWSLAGTSLWRWIALFVLAVVLAALTRALVPLAAFFLRIALKRVAPATGREAIDAFIGPLRLLVAVALFRIGMVWVAPSQQLGLYLGRLLALLFFGAIFGLILAILDLGVVRLRVALETRHRRITYSALPLVARVLKIVIFVVLLAALLSEWGYNTTTIVASLGVGGIAVALAAQKTIENFFGGVSVVADRPVAVGDFCKFGDRSGVVEDIGLRSTRIRTPDRTLVTVPNGQFSTMTIENFSKRDKMLFHFALNLRRDTQPAQVRTLLASIADILRRNEKIDAGPSSVQFVGVGTYSLDLDVTAYILTASDDESARIRQDLLLAILDAVEDAGTALALPTQASIPYSSSTNTPHAEPVMASSGDQKLQLR